MSTFTDSALLVRSNPAALLALGASEQLHQEGSVSLADCPCWEGLGELCQGCWDALVTEQPWGMEVSYGLPLDTGWAGL